VRGASRPAETADDGESASQHASAAPQERGDVVRSTASEEPDATQPADASSGRREESRSGTGLELRDAASAQAEGHDSAPASPDTGTRPATTAAVGAATRTRTTPAAQDAPPQAAIAAWRQYVEQPAETTAATAKGAVQQAFRTAQQEVVQQARLLGDGERSEVTVRMHPPELGRMKVEIEMQSGKVDVKIRVEDSDVREAMRAELQNLDRTLRAMEVEPSRIEVSDYTTGRQGAHDGATGGQPDDAPSGAAYGVADPEELQRTAGWTVFSESGGIDCLV
jgi:flagellar hook-length control protein FliK